MDSFVSLGLGRVGVAFGVIDDYVGFDEGMGYRERKREYAACREEEREKERKWGC